MMSDNVPEEWITKQQSLKLFCVLMMRIDREACKARILNLKALLCFVIMCSLLSVSYKKVCGVLGLLISALVVYILVDEYKKLQYINAQMRLVMDNCDVLNEE